MLSVQLMNNSSPVDKIGKSLSAGSTYNCALKDDTSVLDPVIILQTSDNIFSYNYMYIQEFGRYYFIKDIKSLNNNRWQVSAHVDVLETYKTQILANSAVIKRQEKLFNLYLDDPEYKTLNYERIQTLKFKGGTGFTKSLKYVLTVNGSYEENAGGGGNG
jgi:hypothetical protein